jgi:hypothetical protein
VNRKLFLTWQDKQSRKWFPIGQLTFDGEVYRFFYIQGALKAQSEAGFQPLVSFPDFRDVYESDELFPMFSNRVMPSSRPEYKETVELLSLPENYNDPLAFLARSGGAKITDKFEIFCYPKFENEKFNLHFFAHGLRYLPECSIERIGTMEREEQIYLAHDFQNPFESDALQLHTRDNHIVGYCPSYLLDDMNEMRRYKDIEVCVERVNNESAPLQFRLLCRLIFPQMQNYRPFAVGSYEPVVSEIAAALDDLDVTFA